MRLDMIDFWCWSWMEGWGGGGGGGGDMALAKEKGGKNFFQLIGMNFG